MCGAFEHIFRVCYSVLLYENSSLSHFGTLYLNLFHPIRYFRCTLSDPESDTLREHSTSHPYRVVSEKGVVWMLPESK